MDAKERTRLRALCEAATPGPWDAIYDEDAGEWTVRTGHADVAVLTWQQALDALGLSPVTMRTAAFIAASRAAIPALLDALDAAERERDEARAEVERLRAELADHHTASVLPRETALRETAEALGFTHMGAQGFAGMARRQRDAAIAAEREACAVICDAIGDAAETERDACCDDRSRSLHAGRMHGADECARAIRARGAGGAT